MSKGKRVLDMLDAYEKEQNKLEQKEKAEEKLEKRINNVVENEFTNKYMLKFIMASVPIGVLFSWFVVYTSIWNDGMLRFLAGTLVIILSASLIRCYLVNRIRQRIIDKERKSNE